MLFALLLAEAVHLEVDAPAECLTREELVTHVNDLGGHLRLADEGTRARTFDVTVSRDGDAFIARIVVRDLVGRETVRSVRNETCVDAGRSASLLVSLALDEEVAAPSPPAEPTPVFRWPQPATVEAPAPPPPAAKPAGSGGFGLGAMYGWRNGRQGTELYAARTYAAWRVGVTRIGGSLAIQHETDSFLGTSTITSDRREITTGRAAAVIGWGAPWNDSIVGFLGEVGVSSGASKTWRPRPYDDTRIDTFRSRHVGFYTGGWLMLQVPWKYAFRPVGGLGVMYTPTGPDLPVAFAGEMGLVWQAW